MSKLSKLVLTWIALVVALVCMRLFFPTLGFYLFCFSVVVLYRLYCKQSRLKKNIISFLIFIIAWLSLVDTVTEWQGFRIAGMLCEYSNIKHMPDNKYLSSGFNMMAYTPYFTKFSYRIKNNSPEGFEDIELSFTDIWGNRKEYCDGDGEFERPH